MGLRVFSSIGESFESAATIINSSSAAISQLLVAVVTLALTIWVMHYAMAVYRGETQQPIMNFIAKNYKILFFLVVGLSTGVFQNLIVPAVMDFNTGLMNAVANSSKITGVASCSAAGAYGALDCFAESTLSLVMSYLKQALSSGVMHPIDALLYAFCGFLIFLAGALFSVFMAFEIIEARLMLFMALGLGPLFIVCGAFTKTESFFNNWVAKLANLAILNALLMIYVAMALKIFMGSFGDMINAVSQAGQTVQVLDALDVVPGLTSSTTSQATSYADGGSTFLIALQIVLEVLVLAFLATKVPSLASGLTGGGYGGSGAAAFVAGMMTQQLTKSIASSISKSGGAVGGAGRAGWNLGRRAFGGGGNSMEQGQDKPTAAQRATDRATQKR